MRGAGRMRHVGRANSSKDNADGDERIGRTGSSGPPAAAGPFSPAARPPSTKRPPPPPGGPPPRTHGTTTPFSTHGHPRAFLFPPTPLASGRVGPGARISPAHTLFHGRERAETKKVEERHDPDRHFWAATVAKVVAARGASKAKERTSKKEEEKASRASRRRKAKEEKTLKAFGTVEGYLLRIVRWKRKVVEREKRVTGRKIREILLYLVFLLLFFISTVWIFQDQDLFRLQSSLRDLFVGTEFDPVHSHVLKNFADIGNVEDFWDYMHGPFFESLYTDATLPWAQYSVPGGSDDDPPGEPNPNNVPPGSGGNLFGVLRVIGGVRVAQVRLAVTPGMCQSAAAEYGWLKESEGSAKGSKVLQPSELRCFGGGLREFSSQYEETDEFGVGNATFRWKGETNLLSYSVEEERALFGSQVRSPISARTFPAPAYAVVLPNRNPTKALSKIDELSSGRYIDEQTRAVTVHVVLYNAQMDVFAIVQLMVEFPKSGGAFPSARIVIARLFTLFDSRESPWWIIEIFVVAFFGYFLLVEALRIYLYGWRQVLAVGNVLHNANLFFYIIVWITRFIAFLQTPSGTSFDPEADTYFASLRTVANLKRFSILINSINCFLAFFKLTKFVSISPEYSMVTGTLSRASGPALRFLLIFLIVIFGFASAHMLAFGTNVEGFRNASSSTYTLIQSLLGDFDFAAQYEVDAIFGPLLFLLFTAISTFVILNVLIAIVSDAYMEQTESIHRDPNRGKVEREIRNFVLSGILSIPGVEATVQWFLEAQERDRKRRLQAVNTSLLGDKAAIAWQKEFAAARDSEGIHQDEGKGAKVTPSDSGIELVETSASGAAQAGSKTPSTSSSQPRAAGGDLVKEGKLSALSEADDDEDEDGEDGEDEDGRETGSDLELEDAMVVEVSSPSASHASSTHHPPSSPRVAFPSEQSLVRNDSDSKVLDTARSGEGEEGDGGGGGGGEGGEERKDDVEKLTRDDTSRSSPGVLEIGRGISLLHEKELELQSTGEESSGSDGNCCQCAMGFEEVLKNIAGDEFEESFDWESDPELQGGPFQSALARHVNRRIAIKRRLLGSAYQEFVRRQVRLAEASILAKRRGISWFMDHGNGLGEGFVLPEDFAFGAFNVSDEDAGGESDGSTDEKASGKPNRHLRAHSSAHSIKGMLDRHASASSLRRRAASFRQASRGNPWATASAGSSAASGGVPMMASPGFGQIAYMHGPGGQLIPVMVPHAGQFTVPPPPHASPPGTTVSPFGSPASPVHLSTTSGDRRQRKTTESRTNAARISQLAMAAARMRRNMSPKP